MTILVAYATKYGTTAARAASIAEAIGARQASLAVTLADLGRGKRPDPAGYDAVLIGSSIYGGRIMRRVTAFCELNEEALLARPVGLFTCCLARGRHALDQMEDSFPDSLWRAAVCRGLPGGALHPAGLTLLDRILVRSVPHPAGEVDLRDAGEIESIASAMVSALA